MRHNKLVSAFFERKEFKKNEPWSLIKMDSPERRGGKWTTQPHYADTIEFLFTNGIVGEAYIDGVRCEFGEKTALYIPPQAVHSMNYNSGCGEIFCAKVDPVGLEPFLNLENLLEADGLSFDSFAYHCGSYDELIADFRFLAGDGSFAPKLARLIGVFSHLTLRPTGEDRGRAGTRSSELRAIIEWTGQNLGSGLTLSAAAEHFGYNKNYFCDKFRNSVGVSYTNYVNTLRISRACELIERGVPTAAILQECGFSTESYFVQLFARVKGCTPGAYRRSLRK